LAQNTLEVLSVSIVAWSSHSEVIIVGFLIKVREIVEMRGFFEVN
jgi:hypothetical protein